MLGAAPFEPSPDDHAPGESINTLEGNARALDWLWRQVVSGAMPVTDAEKASAILGKAAGLIGRRHTMRELEHMRELVERFEKAQAAAQDRRSKEQFVATGATLSRGRFSVSPDGEPR